MDLYDGGAMAPSHRSALWLALLSLTCCAKPKAWDASLERDRAECTLGIDLPNMACAEACPIKVRSALLRVRGVEEVQVDYDAKRATVYATWPACGADGYTQIIDNLYQRGYRARIVSAY